MAGREPAPSAGGLVPAGPGRRLASLLADGGVVLAGVVGVLAGVALADGDFLVWVAAVLVLVFLPAYFGLYHALGGPHGRAGWTPGQREVGVAVVDGTGAGRIGVGRGLARAAIGVVSTALVLPALLDAALILGSAERRGLRDRLTRSRVVRVPRARRALVPTAPERVAELDGGGPGRSAFDRGLALADRHARRLIGPVLVGVLAMIALAGVLVPAVVSDLVDESGRAVDVVEAWTPFVVVVLLSALFWSQALVVGAFEDLRVAGSASPVEIARGAISRANGLSVLLLVLAPLAVVVIALCWLVLPLLLLARLGLVVQALLVEELGPLAAIARSWQLTRGAAWRATGLLVASGLTVAAGAVYALVALGVVADGLPDTLWAQVPAWGVVILAGAALLAALMAVLGTAWCCLYHDQRAWLDGADDAAAR